MGLPLGAGQLVKTHSRCSPLEVGSIALDQLEDEATAYFTLVATSESSFFSLSSHCSLWVGRKDLTQNAVRNHCSGKMTDTSP